MHLMLVNSVDASSVTPTCHQQSPVAVSLLQVQLEATFTSTPSTVPLIYWSPVAITSAEINDTSILSSLRSICRGLRSFLAMTSNSLIMEQQYIRQVLMTTAIPTQLKQYQ
jgi:hypothetical protein